MSRPTFALIALSVAALGACRDATQITLELSTDADCAGIETAIAVAPSSQVGDRPPATQTQACTDGTIGSLVLVPANDPSGPVAVQVTTSVGTTLQSCLDALANDGDFSQCIVARRSLRFIEHSSLRLPITLSQQCLDVPCDEQTTCIDGGCVDATVDPSDCTGSASDCQPGQGGGGVGGGGVGGGGGAGGGSCEVPTTTAGANLVDGTSFTHLAIAADPDTCRWAVAYAADGMELCVVIVGANGEPVGPTSCEVQPAAISDVDVEAIGSGSFALASWSNVHNAGLRLYRVPSTAPGTPAVTIPGLTGGSLAAREGELLAVSEKPDTANQTTSVVWNTFTLPDLEPTSANSTVLSIEADRPHAAWSGDDLVVSWHNLFTGSSGNVSRFPFPDQLPPKNVIDAPDEIVIASHDSGLAAFAWETVNETTLVGRWTVDGNGVDSDLAPLTGQGSGAEDPTITATSDGWVVGFRFANQGVLTRYLLDGTTAAVHRVVAPFAADIEIAASGDQLGVAWLSTDTVAFRLVEASLAGL